jgi:hypothetical protein
VSNKTEATGFDPGATDSMRAVWQIQSQVGHVLTEIRRAVDKHGLAQTPLNPAMPDLRRLAILVEEIGEVGECLTYDNPKGRDLKHELVQVATMALAWRAYLS